MKILCLILARGGSERVPLKNIKLLCGKPLIAYTIECAKRSKYINRIIVSTDSDEIASVCLASGAQAPFKRPVDISKRDSTELDAFVHALSWLKMSENYEPDLIVKLFPTSPFRKTESVDKAIELLLSDPQADSVRSVRLCSEHPHKMWTVDKEKNRLNSFVPLKQKLPQAHTLSYQLLPQVYIQNACIDVTRPSVIFNKKSITGTEIVPFIMDEIESVDVNTPLDFAVAESLLEKIQLNTQWQDNDSGALPEDLEVYSGYLTVNKNCLICETNENELWAEYGSFKAVQCKKCGFVWINPYLNEEGLKKYYQNYIGMRFKDEVKTKQRQIQYRIDKDFIETFISGGRVLDVGCSGGFFLDVLGSNFDKHGIEFDAEAVKYARENYSFGKNINNIDLEYAPYSPESFDLIIMRGVIEHLPEPRKALKKAASFLKRGGYFYVAATPNVESFCAGLYRQKWNQFHPIRHIFYFSPRTLFEFCISEGLRLVAKDFPYIETPYAKVEKDHDDVLNALQMKHSNRFDKVGRSPAFWGNMMNIIFQKL